MVEPVTTPTREDSRSRGLRPAAWRSCLPTTKADAIEAYHELRSVDPDLADRGSTTARRTRPPRRREKLTSSVVRLPSTSASGRDADGLASIPRTIWVSSFAIQVDGDGSTTPVRSRRGSCRSCTGLADMGCRHAVRGRPALLGRPARRVGIQVRQYVSLIIRQRVTDTTSGFRAVNRHVDRHARVRLTCID